MFERESWGWIALIPREDQLPLGAAQIQTNSCVCVAAQIFQPYYIGAVINAVTLDKDHSKATIAIVLLAVFSLGRFVTCSQRMRNVLCMCHFNATTDIEDPSH